MNPKAATARRTQADPDRARQCTLTAENGAQDVWMLRGVIAEAVAGARIRCDGPWDTADAIANAIHAQGYDVTPRASQAATAANGPGDDHGAEAGPDKPAAGHTEPRQCDGSDDPRKRCGHHHATGLSNGFGGYECCCGDTWRGAPDECLSGAKTGQPVALRDRVYALIGYLTDECAPANLDTCTDAVIPAIREQAIRAERERLAAMLIEHGNREPQTSGFRRGLRAAAQHVAAQNISAEDVARALDNALPSARGDQ